MSVDERHRKLHRRLQEVLGKEEAETLRDDIAGRGVSREELREELRATRDELRDELRATRDELRTEIGGLESRMDLKLEILEERMDRKLATAINEQTKTLYRTFVVSNAAMVLAVAGLAFGAARLT